MADLEDELLTPYEQIREANQLGDRALQAQTAFASARLNPLARERELPVVAEESTEAVVAPPPRPNPLIRPPMPLSTMPVAKQIAWQQLQDKLESDRASINAQLLTNDANRTKQRLYAEQVAQGREMMREIPNLQESFRKGRETGNYDDFVKLRSDLQMRYPGGAISPEIEPIFKDMDAQYGKVLSVQDDLRKGEITRKAAADEARLKAGLAEAKLYGADAVREYMARAGTNIDDANRYLAGRQEENLRTTMAQGGMTPEDIAKYGTGDKFQFAAAQEALKTRGGVGAAQSRATQIYASLAKAREASGFDPSVTEEDPYVATGGRWTPGQEQAYNDSIANLNQGVPQLGGRAGVAGAEDRQSLYRDYARPAPQVVTQPVAAAASQRIPVNQQALTSDPAGTEKVVNGVAVRKYPDGQWRRIK